MTGKKSLIRATLIFSILLVSFKISLGQELTGTDIRINIFWDFYSSNRLSTVNAGRGYTGIAGDNDISGVLLNPASLNLNKKYQGHVEYLYKSDVPWLTKLVPGINLKGYHPSLMAAFGYKYNDYFQTGLLYYTANSQRLDFGEMIITNQLGEELGTTNVYEQSSISNLTLPLVFNYKNKLKAGVNLLYSFYHGYAYYGPYTDSLGTTEIEGKANFGKFNAQFGLIVSPIEDLSFGLSFTPKVEENVVWNFPKGITDAFAKPNVFPMKIGAGGEYRFKTVPLKLAFDYNYVNSSKQDGLKDRNDFHFGAEYGLLKNVDLRAGFFTLKDYRSGTNYLDPLGQYDEYFLTLGGTYKYKKFSASVALLDSHILSSGLIKQTIVNGGLTMDF